MPLDDTFNITRPGQEGATGSVSALHIEEYTGVVETTIARKSALAGWLPMRTVRGTSVLQNFAVGESTLQKLTPGTAPDGTVNKFGKNTVTVDTVVLARSVFPLLETFQTSYDARKEVGEEHGRKIAKFRDQTVFIQAIRTALLTAPKHTGMTGAGHFGATQKTLAGANDHLDPAKLYAAIVDMIVGMQNKDVDVATDDVMLAVKPQEFATLAMNEMLINRQYVTSDGTNIDAMVLKTYGLPVIQSNNFPGGETISGHLMHNVSNGNTYDGDYTKAVGVAFSARALLAGETIPLTTGVFWDDVYKHWMVDAWMSYAIGPNRPEFAAILQKP